MSGIFDFINGLTKSYVDFSKRSELENKFDNHCYRLKRDITELDQSTTLDVDDLINKAIIKFNEKITKITKDNDLLNEYRKKFLAYTVEVKKHIDPQIKRVHNKYKSDNVKTLYVLFLEHNKYYIGTTYDLINRTNDHKEGNGSEWTKMYKYIKTVEIVRDVDDFDEDKYVKIYMAKYGIDNVRGGSYSKIELDEETKKLLTKEIYQSQDVCFKCGKDTHFVKDCEIYTVYDMFQKEKKDIGTISRIMKKSTMEVENLLVEAFKRFGYIDFNRIGFNNNKRDVILETVRKLEPNYKLSDIKKKLPDTYSYLHIKIALTYLK